MRKTYIREESGIFITKIHEKKLCLHNKYISKLEYYEKFKKVLVSHLRVKQTLCIERVILSLYVFKC